MCYIIIMCAWLSNEKYNIWIIYDYINGLFHNRILYSAALEYSEKVAIHIEHHVDMYTRERVTYTNIIVKKYKKKTHFLKPVTKIRVHGVHTSY